MSSKNASSKRAARPKDPNDDEEQESMVPAGMLPSYLAEAFGELYEEDGLLVLGKGLGLLSLLATFVRFYSDTKEGHASMASQEKNNGKPPLIFVLGLREAERNVIVSILETWGTDPELLPTMITNESGQGKDRAGASVLIWCSGVCWNSYHDVGHVESILLNAHAFSHSLIGTRSHVQSRRCLCHYDSYSHCRSLDQCGECQGY